MENLRARSEEFGGIGQEFKGKEEFKVGEELKGGEHL